MEIQQWMKESQTTNPPRNQNSSKSVPEREAKLGANLNYIKQNLIKPYQKIKSEEEKKEYKKQHPEVEEIMLILEEIDRNNIPIKEEQTYYINILEIKKWMEKNDTTNPPRPQYKDKHNNKTVPEEEAKLGAKLSAIRQNLIKPYIKLKTEDEKNKFKKKHPEVEDIIAIVKEIDDNKLPIYLKNAIEIKKWMEERNTTKPPRTQNPRKTVPEEEARLGRKLSNIRQDLIKPYKEAKSKEDKEKLRKKYPYIENVIKILDEIGQNNVPIKKELVYYKNVLEIKKWMEERNTTKPPRIQQKDKNGNKTVPEQEAKLGSNLRSIRRRLINPYQEIRNEQEREKFIKQHYKIEEIIKIIDEIDRNGNRVVSEEEAKLGAKLGYIMQDLIKPYRMLKSREEKETYKRKHPELEDVMAMIEEIDRNNPTKNKVKSTIVSQKNNGTLGENYEVEKEFEKTIRQVEQNIDKEDGER